MPDKNSRAPRRKAVNLNSQWLQNTLKSMGIAASDALGELLPATSGTISTGAKVASDAARTLRATKGGSRLVQNALMNNQLVKTGQSFFKNAIDDLKSGNWNEDRSDVGEMFDDMDDMFGDMDEMFDDDEGTDVNIENNINSGGDATLKAIDRQAEYTVRSAKAMTDTMVSIGSASLIKVEEIGSKTLSELVNINSTLSAILDYNNTNMTRFIEASIGYYDQMMTRDESSTTSSEIRPENLYSDRGLDVGSYKDYIKQNILKLKDESTVGSMVSMIAENADMLFANPINAGMKMLVKGLIPSVAKNAMQAFDESVQNFIPFILEKIGHLGEGKGGMLGTALQYVGRIFGVRSTATKDVDFSNIKTGPVPYNGMANHTIVEIIPKYLRESNNYLREIAEKITGKSDEEMSKNVTGFDWESGRFKRLEDIKRGNIESLTNESVGTLLNSEFGKKLTAIMSSDKVLTDANDRKNSSNAIQQMILNMLEHQGEMDFASSDYLDAILKITSSDNIKNALRDALTEMQATSDSAIGSAKGTIGRARTTHNNAIRILRENASTNGLYQTEAGNATTDLIQQERDYLISNISTAPTPTPPPAPPTPGPSGSPISPEEAASARREAIRTSLADQNANTNTSGSAGSILATPFATGKKMLDAVMAGNSDQAWDAFMNGFKESFSKMGKFLSTHFFTPIKNALFGTKDENGYKHGGIFEGVNNRMKESFYSFRRLITGKGYKTADGSTVPDASAEEMENTVVGKLKKSVNWFKDAIKERLFGKEDESDTPDDKKGGLLGKAKRGIAGATSSLLKGLTGWKNALFGKSEGNDEEDEEQEGKDILEDLKKKAAEVAPSAITGAVGGGLLGMMVGGPIGGALLGFAGGILKKSERFNNWLFGEKDENGERTGGAISKNMQDYMKKNGKFLAGGAAIGAIRGAFTGGGLLGSIIGGPVAGALMGLGTSIILKSDAFHKFIFGDLENGQIGMKGHLDRWMKKLGSNADTGDASGSKLAGMMGVGALGGGLLGALVGGPVVGAVLGLGTSILAQKDNFHEWLFGKVDEETGEKKEGIFGKFKNMLIVDVINPIKNSAKFIIDDAKDFVKHGVLGRLGIIAGEIGDSFVSAVSRITGSAMSSLSDFGNYIKTNFLDKLVSGLGKVFSPLTKAATKIGEGMYSAGKALISAPLKLVHSIFSPAVHAVTTVVGGVTKAIGATIKTVVLKPLNALVLKPLAGAVKLAGNVIAAPFKLVSNMFNWVNEKIIGTFRHITRFFGAVTDKVKNAIGNAIDKHIKQPLVEMGRQVKSVILKPFNIIADAAKSVLGSIADYTKKKIHGFFSSMLKALNPINWIKGAFKLGKNVFNKITGRSKDNQSSDEGNTSNSRFGRIGSSIKNLWRATATGTGKDYSAGAITDENGNVVDSKLSAAQRWKNNEEQREAAHRARLKEYQERRQQNKNQSLIKKYTKGQRFQDTAENRELAEAAVGHKIAWLTEDPTEKSKTDKFQDQTLETQQHTEENTGKTEEHVRKILEFLGVNKKSAASKSSAEKAADIEEAKKQGISLQTNRNAREEKTQEAASQGTYHDKRDARDARYVDKRVTNREDEMRRKARAERSNDSLSDLWHNIRQDLAFSSGRFSTLFKRRKGRDEDTDTVDTNATGTSGARPGFSIVGEQGPEVVYGKNGKYGKFVGLHGPEVVRMKGGETVIPNSRIARYEDGTDGYEGPTLTDLVNGGKGMSDDDLAKVTDTSKLSIGERILKSITDIKAFILSVFTPKKARKATISSDDNSMAEQQDAQAQVSGLTGDHAVSTEATIVEPPSGSIIEDTDSISLGTMASRVGDPTSIADSSNTDMVNDGAENTMADQQAAQAQVATLTGDSLRAQAEIDKDKERKELREEEKLATLKELGRDTKSHNSAWDSIFSKKGLITAGLLAAAPLLIKLLSSGVFKSIWEGIKGVWGVVKDIWGYAKDFVTRVVKGIGATIKDILADLGWTNEHHARDNGDTVEERISDDADRMANYQIFDENGNADNLSAPMARGAARLGLTIANSAVRFPFESKLTRTIKTGANIVKATGRGIGKATKAAGRGIGNVAKTAITKGANFIKDTKAVASLAREAAIKEYGDDAIKAAYELADNKGVEIAAKVVNKVKDSKIAKKAAELAEPLVNKAKDSKLLTWVCNAITGFFDDILAKFNKKTGAKATTSIFKKFGPSKIIDAVKSKWNAIAEKIATALGIKGGATAVTAGLSEAVFIGISALDGYTGAAKLFQVRQEDVDGKMKTIATILGGIKGTTVGSVIDIVCSLIYDIFGVDLLGSLAVGLYNFWANDEDSAKLENAQNVFKQDYEKYQATEIEKQYNTQKSTGVISQDMTLEQFKEGVYAGEINVTYKGMDDYNADVNASLGDKTMKVISKTGKGIAKGWNWLVGKDEKVYTYTGPDGEVYTAKNNGDGSYEVYNSQGEDMGPIAKDALLSIEGVQESTIKKDNIFQKAGKGLASAGKWVGKTAKKLGQGAWKGIKSAAGWVGDRYKDVWNGATKLASKAWDGIKSTSTKAWNATTEFVSKTWNKVKDKANMVLTPVKNFLASHKETAWFDSDGSYYIKSNKGYTHYNASGSQIGDPLSDEDFEALLVTGNLTEGEVTVDSGLKSKIKDIGNSIKESWNKFTSKASSLWNSVKEKAGNLISKAKDKITGVATSVKNFFVSHTEKAWFDSDGGYYKSSDSGFIHYNASGSQIGDPISAEEFQALITSGAVVEGELQVDSGLGAKLKSIGSTIKDSWNKFTSGASNLWSSIKEKAGGIFNSIVEAGGPIGFIGGLFTKKKETAWYDTNGDYYVQNSSGDKYTKYNMNGDVLEEDIDAEKVEELAAAGLLTKGEIETDSEAQKAIKDIKGAVKEAWKTAKSTVKSAWNSFKNWITGGSGSNADIINDYRPNNSSNSYGGYGYLRSIPGGSGEPSTLHGIPFYSQNDKRWANREYEQVDIDDHATMADTGCGPTAMSMVIGKMTDNKPLPTELADYAQFTGTRDSTGTNWNFIDSAASTYGLHSTRSINPSKEFISQNLSKGNPMILSGQSTGLTISPYTRAGHYIVATGIDSNGNVSYNDPRGSMYSGSININSIINNTGAAWSFDDATKVQGGFGPPDLSNLPGYENITTNADWFAQNDSTGSLGLTEEQRKARQDFLNNPNIPQDVKDAMMKQWMSELASNLSYPSSTSNNPYSFPASLPSATTTSSTTTPITNTNTGTTATVGLWRPTSAFSAISPTPNTSFLSSGTYLGRYALADPSSVEQRAATVAAATSPTLPTLVPQSLNIFGNTQFGMSQADYLDPSFLTSGTYTGRYALADPSAVEQRAAAIVANSTNPASLFQPGTSNYATISGNTVQYTGPQLIVAIAASQIGVAEAGGNDNRVPYNDEYYGKRRSGDDVPWCCAFVWWVFKHAGLSDLFGPKTAGCGTFYSNHTNDTIPFEQARAGDIVLYHPSGSYSHIGIVSADYNPETKTIQTIEGNSGNKVSNHKSVANSDPPKVIVHPHYTNALYSFDVTPLATAASMWKAGNHNITMDGTLPIQSGTYDMQSQNAGFQLSGDIITDVGSIFSLIGNTLFNAAVTGNTDVDWQTVFARANGTSADQATFTGDGYASLVIPPVLDGGPTFGNNTGQMLSTDAISSFPTSYDFSSASVISPTDRAETTWKYFKSMGASDVGTAGVLGNLYAESNVIANNLQSAPPEQDEIYTANVDNGSYTGEQFSSDRKGYGLAQWTYPTLKEKLYAYRNARRTSIGNHDMQDEFLYRELYGDYPDVFNFMNSTTDVGHASTAMVRFFERPGSVSDPNSDKAHETYNKRAGYAKGFYDLYAGKYPTGGGYEEFSEEAQVPTLEEAIEASKAAESSTTASKPTEQQLQNRNAFLSNPDIPQAAKNAMMDQWMQEAFNDESNIQWMLENTDVGKSIQRDVGLYIATHPPGGGGGFGTGPRRHTKPGSRRSKSVYSQAPFTIQNRRYVTNIPAPPVDGGSGDAPKEVSHPIKSTINMHELSKSSGGYGFIQSNTFDTYDDTVVVQMMNQIVRYLSSISTNTKKLDLLSDIKDRPTTIINANNGNTNVERTARDIVRENTSIPRSSPNFSRSELRARSIAGIV